MRAQFFQNSYMIPVRPARLSLLNIFYNVESIFFSDYVLLVVMDQYK